MLPKALHDAAAAKLTGELRGFDLCLLILLYGRLDVYRYRPLKLRSLVRSVSESARRDVHASNVRRSVRRLEQLGYLERGPREHRSTTYRLLISPTPVPGKMRHVPPVVPKSSPNPL